MPAQTAPPHSLRRTPCASPTQTTPQPHPPRRTLDWTYGYHAGKNPSFLWQWVGAAFFFLFSAITYTLTERSVVGRLHTTVPKVLNVGLLVASLFFILDFGTLIFNSPIAVGA